jgi:hypothetical protein
MSNKSPFFGCFTYFIFMVFISAYSYTTAKLSVDRLVYNFTKVKPAIIAIDKIKIEGLRLEMGEDINVWVKVSNQDEIEHNIGFCIWVIPPQSIGIDPYVSDHWFTCDEVITKPDSSIEYKVGWFIAMGEPKIHQVPSNLIQWCVFVDKLDGVNMDNQVNVKQPEWTKNIAQPCP